MAAGKRLSRQTSGTRQRARHFERQVRLEALEPRSLLASFTTLEDTPLVIDVPTGRPLLVSPAGFAVNTGDPDFLAFLNAWITAREADTWLPTTASYWFESLRWRERLGNAR